MTIRSKHLVLTAALFGLGTALAGDAHAGKSSDAADLQAAARAHDADFLGEAAGEGGVHRVAITARSEWNAIADPEMAAMFAAATGKSDAEKQAEANASSAAALAAEFEASLLGKGYEVVAWPQVQEVLLARGGDAAGADPLAGAVAAIQAGELGDVDAILDRRIVSEEPFLLVQASLTEEDGDTVIWSCTRASAMQVGLATEIGKAVGREAGKRAGGFLANKLSGLAGSVPFAGGVASGVTQKAVTKATEKIGAAVGTALEPKLPTWVAKKVAEVSSRLPASST